MASSEPALSPRWPSGSKLDELSSRLVMRLGGGKVIGYSQRFQNAWYLAKEMQGRGYWMRLESPHAMNDLWWCGFALAGTERLDQIAPGGTAAEAICRAAVATVQARDAQEERSDG